ncbi:MAG: hypothetical protein OXI24_14230 [Candidatus Poribacteria bacterium]|nr:hypothetical protein [Candidatus Poribacteria bacterium]MYK19443.1 type II toxin-antitoxin system Phd/YefM family antitoxin [Candidatus Poribacteria bacterium]
MNKTISLDDLPRQVENLLRATWEAHESLVLKHNGKPVAAIVPMDEYRKLHPDEDENALAYELPMQVLEAYHSLLDKKFSTGLTKEEEITLSKLDQQLDKAEAAQPLIQSMQRRSAARDKNWMQRFDEVIAKLRELRELV